MRLYIYYHNEQHSIYDVLVDLSNDKCVLFFHGVDRMIEYDDIKIEKSRYGTYLLFGNGGSILWKEVHGSIYGKWKEINLDFISLDVETATTDQMICQIGISIIAEKKIVGSKSWLVKPPSNKYDRQCVKVHHITEETTRNSPTFSQVWQELSDYLIGNPVVAHNATNFDEVAIRKNLAFYRISDLGLNPFIDTVNLWGKRVALDDLCAGFGWPVDGHHDAKWDAEACAKIYLEYLAGSQPNWDLVEKHHLIKEKESNKYDLDVVDKKRIGGDVLVNDLSNASFHNNPFYDRKVVITGDFLLDRKEMAQILKDFGADVNTSISKLTNYVLIGSAPGPSKMSKLAHLKEQGYDIRVLHESDFNRIINGIKTENLEEYMTR